MLNQEIQVGPIAQSVEQRTFNPWVDGSSPSGPTVFFSRYPIGKMREVALFGNSVISVPNFIFSFDLVNFRKFESSTTNLKQNNSHSLIINSKFKPQCPESRICFPCYQY